METSRLATCESWDDFLAAILNSKKAPALSAELHKASVRKVDFASHSIVCRFEPSNPSSYVTVVVTNVGADYTSLG